MVESGSAVDEEEEEDTESGTEADGEVLVTERVLDETEAVRWLVEDSAFCVEEDASLSLSEDCVVGGFRVLEVVGFGTVDVLDSTRVVVIVDEGCRVVGSDCSSLVVCCVVDGCAVGEDGAVKVEEI